MAVALAASPTPAQPDDATAPAAGAEECLATGYLLGPDEDLTALRERLTAETVHDADGVVLSSGRTWLVPDGSRPVVVLDSTTELITGTATMTLGGQEVEIATRSLDDPDFRYVSNVDLPHLGGVIRSLGLTVRSGPCDVAVPVLVDRSLWTTAVGGAGIGLTALFGLLLVLVARLRKGGWWRRFLFAAPFGLLAGLFQGVVLLESGLIDPFAGFPWWAPVAGLGLAAVLPLTRWGRGRKPAVAAGVSVPPPPAQAPLAGFQVVAPVGVTPVAGIYRGVRVPPTVVTDPGASTATAVPTEPGTPAVPADPAATVVPTEAATAQVPVAAATAGAVPPGGVPSGGAPDQALLKVAFADRYGDPWVRMRLEREVTALSGWEHPNVLRLREAVPAPEGPPTLIFDDPRGAPVRGLVGGLSGPQVVTVVLGVLAGLQAVHERGLVHRDVRPENVWVADDGGVLLAGFEAACAGVEHPVAPEGVDPYASPEQRAAGVLDGRSDVYSCAVMLQELLTGQAAPGQPAPGATSLPDPLVGVLGAALAVDREARPGSAEELAGRLRLVAEQVFGPDWAGRGALAGAAAAYGALGAGAAGYGVAGGAGAAGVGGAAGSTAGLGAAPGAVGSTAPGAAGLGAAVAPGAAGASVAAAPVGTGVVGASVAAAPAGGASGPVVALVNASVAAAAAVVLVVGAVLVDPRPAEAQELLITPDQARMIFVRSIGEGWDGSFGHFTDDTQDSFEALGEVDDSIEGVAPTEVEVGVPPDQFEYPAWFVASGQLPFDDGTASLFARFDREEADQPWRMTSLRWSTNRLLPPPLLVDGWLAPVDVGDLLIDPESLPERYADWLDRAREDREVGTDEVLVPRFEGGILELLTEEEPFYRNDPADVSSDWTMTPGEVVFDPVPLVDGTVSVEFSVTVKYVRYNRPNHRAGSCDVWHLFWINNDPPGLFRTLENTYELITEAWVPVPGLVTEDPGPGPSPGPSPDPTPGPDDDDEDPEPSELEQAPVDPEEVLFQDRRFESIERGGERC